MICVSSQNSDWFFYCVALKPHKLVRTTFLEYSGNDYFQALLNAIVSKQVSVVAAGAIWKRMEAAGFTSPKTILTASDDELGSAAFSRKK